MAAEFAQMLQGARDASVQGNSKDAADLYQRVLTLDSTNISATVGLGHALRSLGQGVEAIRLYREAIRLMPSSGAAWWALANMKTEAFGPDDLNLLRYQLSGQQSSATNAALLWFSFGKALGDAGDHPAAFTAYTRGNTIMAEIRPYQQDPDTQLLNDLMDCASIAEPAASAVIEEHTTPIPIFIVGMPRSGSTLVEQILGSHPDIGGGGEFSYLADTLIRAADAAGVPIGRQPAALTDDQVRQLRQSYFDAWKSHIGNAPIFIDKQLNNFWLIGQIARCFPSSPIVDVRRHPFDACFGAYKQVFAQGQEFTYSFESYAAYYAMYLEVMAHWKTQLPDKIHSIYLEELVETPQAVLEPILDHARIEWSDDMLDFHRNSRVVLSASSEQVRKPITNAVGYRFAWQAAETADMRNLLSAAKDYPFHPIFRPEQGENREQQLQS